MVCAAVSPALGTLLLAEGAADGVVGVTLTTCEGDCAGAEFVDVVPAAVCCWGDDGVDGGDDGVDGDDDATDEVLGVDVAAGPEVVTVVVASVAEGLVLVPEVASGGDNAVDDDAPDTETEADGDTAPVVGGELGVSVALGSWVATLAFSWFTWSIRPCLRLESLTDCTVLLTAASLF